MQGAFTFYCILFLQGAFTFRGQMIDMPTVLQAKNITQLAEAIQDSQLWLYKSNSQMNENRFPPN